MPTSDSALDMLRKICLSLPETHETLTWGKPHFRVGEKIFCGFGDEAGKPVIGFKLEMDHAARVVKIPGFWRAPYVGHKGWVSMDVSDVRDWVAVAEMITESYRLIAPKRLVTQLAATGGRPETLARPPRAKKSVPAAGGRAAAAAPRARRVKKKGPAAKAQSKPAKRKKK